MILYMKRAACSIIEITEVGHAAALVVGDSPKAGQLLASTGQRLPMNSTVDPKRAALTIYRILCDAADKSRRWPAAPSHDSHWFNSVAGFGDRGSEVQIGVSYLWTKSFQ